MLAACCLAAGSAQIVLGSVWWVANLGHVPAYGDTPEYVDLAHVLQVDEYRTLAYPLLVRGAIEVGAAASVPWQVPLYLVQTALAVLAGWYLTETVLAGPIGRRGAWGQGGWRRGAWRAWAAAVVVTLPLSLHYATTVLPDSLATSFTLLCLTALGRLSASRRLRTGTLLLAAVGAAGAVLMRPEKTYVIGVVAVLLGLLLLVRGLRTRPRAHRIRASAASFALLLPVLGATEVNHATQTADYGRPEMTPAVAALDRAVTGHLAEVVPRLPARVQASLPPQTVEAFDHAGITGAMQDVVQRLRAVEGGDDRMLVEAVRLAVRCCWPDIAAHTLVDGAKFVGAPATFAVDYVTDADSPTQWNVSRMAAAHPRLTAFYLWSSFLLLGGLLVAATAAICRRPRGTRTALLAGTAAVPLLGTVVNGLFFAAVSSLTPNVRYVVSGYVILYAVLLAVAVAGPGAGRRPPADAEAAERPTPTAAVLGRTAA